MTELHKRQRVRSDRANELVEDMQKIGKYLNQADGEAYKALDLLHLLLMESYQKVSGTKV
jgi:hypothetical protein